MQDIRYVGMIRTPSFKKAIGMFKPENIIKIRGARGIQKSCDVHRLGIKKVPYFVRRTTVRDDYDLDWNGPGVFSPKVVLDSIENVELGDFTIECIEYMFGSASLASKLNDLVHLTCKGKKCGEISAHEKMHATFLCNSDAELRQIPGQRNYLKELNQFEIDEYGFKVSCLDLVDLHTDRVERYGEKETLSVSDTDLIQEVFRALDWNGWPKEKRTLVEDAKPTLPCAIRQYRLSEKQKWTLTGQEEVNGKQ